MLLNELKNNEVYPYFWKLRKQIKKASRLELIYIDLQRLNDLLSSKQITSDSDLETLLYGTFSKPIFSGWTSRGLKQVLEGSGFNFISEAPEDKCFTKAIIEPSPWSLKDRKKAVFFKGEQQIWDFRKAARAKAGETFAKIKSSFLINIPTQDIALNLGAGEELHDGFIKVDWGGKQDIYDNIVTLSKFKPNSISKIYTNHVVEHISIEYIDKMLLRWNEILKPKGTLFLRAPDAKQSILHLEKNYSETTPEEILRLGFPNYLQKERISEKNNFFLDTRSAIQCVYGWSDSTPFKWDLSNQHKSLWTPELCNQRLKRAGFHVEFCQNLGDLQTLAVARKNS